MGQLFVPLAIVLLGCRVLAGACLPHPGSLDAPAVTLVVVGLLLHRVPAPTAGTARPTPSCGRPHAEEALR